MFVLSVRFPPPNIINTYSLIYQSNFPATSSLVKTFREMRVKLLLLNFFVPQKVPMRTSVITESIPKFFSASYVLFMVSFTSKKVIYILRTAIQILWSNGIYALHRWWSKLVCFGNMLMNFIPWFIVGTTETFLGLKWRYFGSQKDVL